MPLVSWLIATHVNDEFLHRALQSVLSQSFANFEVVVVINGPNAAEVAAAVIFSFGSDHRVRVFTTDVRHLTFSLALGLHHARGQLIARMDGDDLSTPDRLERQVAFMDAHPNVVALGTAYELIDDSDDPIGVVQLPTGNSDIRRRLFRGFGLCHPSVMFRREVVIGVGGYLGGVYAQDYDLWARLALNPSNRFANLEDVCLRYRVAGAGGARKARSAYASVAVSQLHNFLMGAGFAWLLAAFLSLVKALLRPKVY